MILSNEPGYYLPGAYGIRLENLELVQAAQFPGAVKKFLHFETLTLAPFDRALIDPSMLSEHALRWLNRYHSRVCDLIGPLLIGPSDQSVLEWLMEATMPI
jgi:Xaa-Pro aminopeptidase